ncbi:MAG: hypothetical protein L0Y71_19675 [Gemmataceae bacterium]|nr:hypothetical protein [Gemmataceae bacterium]
MNQNVTQPATPRLTLEEKLALAKRLYCECYADCFWHMQPDLEITEATLPLIIRGLQDYGGRREFLEAAKLAR